MDHLLNKEEEFSIMELRGIISMGGTSNLDSHREASHNKQEEGKNQRKNSSRTSTLIY